MLDYWTRGGKIVLVGFVLIGIIGLPTAFYMGTSFNNQAYDLLNSQYITLLSRYEELSILYDVLLLDHVALEVDYQQALDSNTIAWNLVAYWQAQVDVLNATIQYLEMQLQTYIGMIRDMPFYQRLLIWANGVRVYTYGKYVDVDQYQFDFMVNMTKHNANIENLYGHVDDILGPILGFTGNDSMNVGDIVMGNMFDYYNTSSSISSIYGSVMFNTDPDDKGWAFLQYGNTSYFFRSALETGLERIGDDIDQTILLGALLASSGYDCFVATHTNSTNPNFVDGKRSFVFVDDPTNSSGHAYWSIASKYYTVLDPLDDHVFTALPSWLGIYMLENNTQWMLNTVKVQVS